MNKPNRTKTIGIFMASFLIFMLFILMAGGSILTDLLSQFYLPDISRKTLEDGRIQEIHEYKDSYICEERVWHYKLSGHYDTHMRWHGLLRIEKVIEDHGVERVAYTEEVMMVHGKRDGLSTTIHADGRTTYKVYNMGHEVEDLEGQYKGAKAVSAFALLDSRYSWLQEMFHASGYEDHFLKTYLDTFEILLDTYEMNLAFFDSIYGEVEDRLDDTRFDTLTRLNTNFFSFVNGMELLKEADFRLAVIDQYREEGSSLSDVIHTSYPGYLISVKEEGVNDFEFASFCLVFDSTMNSYGSVDKSNPVTFIDSLDTRIYRALTSMYNMGQTKSGRQQVETNSGRQQIETLIQARKFRQLPVRKSARAGFSPPDVAEVVLNDLFGRYIEGNVFRRCLLRSWSINHNLILLPTLTTSPAIPMSSSSVEIKGLVLEDGGAPVTSRGIAWAAHYNPSLQDNTESSGSGSGTFSVILDGLTEGRTYYARSYATNLSGTSYGNCMSFTTDESTTLETSPLTRHTLELYPNPASDVIWLKTTKQLSATARIVITRLNGQVVFFAKFREQPEGVPGFRLDVSSLGSGEYVCQIHERGRLVGTKKLLIIK